MFTFLDYLKVTIIYRYIFWRFWDPKHFTGIKFRGFHANMLPTFHERRNI